MHFAAIFVQHFPDHEREEKPKMLHTKTDSCTQQATKCINGQEAFFRDLTKMNICPDIFLSKDCSMKKSLGNAPSSITNELQICKHWYFDRKILL